MKLFIDFVENTDSINAEQLAQLECLKNLAYLSPQLGSPYGDNFTLLEIEAFEREELPNNSDNWEHFARYVLPLIDLISYFGCLNKDNWKEFYS